MDKETCSAPDFSVNFSDHKSQIRLFDPQNDPKYHIFTSVHEGIWKFPTVSEDDSVRLPKPLSNLMKGGGVGFKLTGADDFLQSERGIELQKQIDDEYRELAVKVLGHVRDFKTHERLQLQSLLTNSEASLTAQVKELYETTEVSAAVRTERVAAALEQERSHR